MRQGLVFSSHQLIRDRDTEVSDSLSKAIQTSIMRTHLQVYIISYFAMEFLRSAKFVHGHLIKSHILSMFLLAKTKSVF